MRKYLFDRGVVGAAFLAIPALRATVRSTRDHTTLLLWGAAAVAMTVAVLSVQDRSAALRTPAGDGTSDDDLQALLETNS
jgi:hypothetical protein